MTTRPGGRATLARPNASSRTTGASTISRLTTISSGVIPRSPPPSLEAKSGVATPRGESAPAVKPPRSGPVNLWDLATERFKERKTEENKETTILVVGGRAAGKTTIVHQFLEKKEALKETVALECSFGRKMHLGKPTKDIAQFWELGGGLTATSLIQVPLTLDTVANAIIILVVDLSAPSDVWTIVTKLLDEISKQLDSLRISPANQVEMKERIKRIFQDKNMTNDDMKDKCPIMLPLIIIGNKFDEYQGLHTEEKRLCAGALRFLALFYGGALVFSDHKTTSLITRVKSYISHLCFDHSLPNGVVQDCKNPIVIPWGKDNFDSVGTPYVVKGWKYTADKKLNLYDMWRRVYEEVFGAQKVSVGQSVETETIKDPTTHYPEQAIDVARRAKEYEIEKYRREKEKEKIATKPDAKLLEVESNDKFDLTSLRMTLDTNSNLPKPSSNYSVPPKASIIELPEETETDNLHTSQMAELKRRSNSVQQGSRDGRRGISEAKTKRQ